MEPIKRAVLALVLMAGIAPAVAQVPSPVPALPDTERRTTYSISASNCACNVNFALYGDATDFNNWLEVWLNGVNIAYTDAVAGWTITVPTGSLATRARPISDAVLTFNTPQTGTVQIVGARRPRRVLQFAENAGVPARNLNQALTDIIAMQREAWDKITDVSGRTVQAPPGETLNTLPPRSGRASMLACYDSGGNLTACLSPSSGTFAAGNGIQFTGTGPTTVTNNIVAGNGVVFTGTNPITISVSSTISPSFTCDGSTDFGTQLQALINANTGKTIYIPPGPDCLTSVSLALPSNTTITGGGREVSTIRSTTANPVFTSLNATNISLSGFWCKGSDAVVSWSASSYGCFKFQQNASAVSAGANYSFQNMKFSGFNSSYWMYMDSIGSTQLLRNITFSNNYILTATADIPTDGTATNNSNYGLVIYSGSAGNGRVENTIIRNNRVEGAAMCFPIVLFSNHYKFQVNDNAILQPGLTTPGHCVSGLGTNNAYGILVYDLNSDGNPPTDGLVENNSIISPLGAGIYFAGDGTGGHTTSVYNSSRSVISGNLIEGQSSQDDTLLARGGIVIGLPTDFNIVGNMCWNNFGCIAATGQQTGVVNIVGNNCFSQVTSSTSTVSCIRLGSGVNGSSNTSKHIVKSNYLELSDTTSNGGSVIRASSATGARFGDVEVTDNTINAGWTGINFQNQFVAGSFVVKGNKFGGIANNYMFSPSSLTGSPVAITNNVFDSIAGVNGNGLVATSSVIHMVNNKFINRASGTVTMFNAVGSCGTIIGTQFNSVVQPAQVTVSSLGTANPSGCTLNYLDQVQNLTPSEQGTASSKYVVDHWVHVSTTASTTHLDQRQLTGN